MNPAIFLHVHSSASSYLRRHWPYFKASGVDLFGVTRLNTRLTFPEPIPTRAIGDEHYILGDNQPRRIIDTFRWFNEDARFKNHTHAWIMQADSLILGKLPEIEADIAGLLNGGPCKGFKASCFYHPPWIVSHKGAAEFIECGEKLLAEGECEHGIPDYFFALVCETMGVKVQTLEGALSVNSTTLMTEHVEHNIAAIKAGAWYVHGVKTQAELDWVLKHRPKTTKP